MSAFETDDFPPPSLEEQQRMQKMEASELAYNIKMLQDIRKYNPQETPCQTFYKLKKGIPLSLFIKVYPFNELVDCASKFQLEELMELKRLYSTFEESDQQLYIDSFQRLQEIENIVEANQKAQTVLNNTVPVPPPVPQTLFGKITSLFGRGGGRKTSKKMYQKRLRSRSKKSQYKKSKSRSKSRSKK